MLLCTNTALIFSLRLFLSCWRVSQSDGWRLRGTNLRVRCHSLTWDSPQLSYFYQAETLMSASWFPLLTIQVQHDDPPSIHTPAEFWKTHIHEAFLHKRLVVLQLKDPSMLISFVIWLSDIRILTGCNSITRCPSGVRMWEDHEIWIKWVSVKSRIVLLKGS